MNGEWACECKEFQKLISKEATFAEGIKKLLELRSSLFDQISQIVRSYPKSSFWKMPFAGNPGYHGKTLSYSIWHIFRIEDIVCHTLILNDSEIFEKGGWKKKIGAEIITTGNELKNKEIEEFSKKMLVKPLEEYAMEVMLSTNDFLKNLSFKETKKTFHDEDRKRILESKCVSTDENALWLIDYWCGKNVSGLLKMPFSRHWIMHVEAMLKITNRLCSIARKGVDPVAFCGLSCRHCFWGECCGSCRTEFNVCSFATCSPDGICPNAKCCMEKEIDGCWECSEIKNCKKGFYDSKCDRASAAKAQAIFIGKHGKKEFLKLQDKLHSKFDFSKVQEILEQDLNKGLEILESNYMEKNIL